ncbi:MAG: GAF domain-containing SpoIIE family protein phosphatase [Planctomycetota bacterium]
MAFWKKRPRRAEDGSGQGSATSPLGAGSGSPVARGAGGSDGDPGGHGSSGFLRGDAREDTRSLELLLDTIARVSASRDLESLLDFVVDSSIEATGAERGFLVLLDPATGDQVVRVARTRGDDDVATPLGRDVKYSTTVVQKVIDEEAPIRTTVQKNAEDLELGQSVFDLKLRAVMCVPLVTRGGGPDGRSGGALNRGALYVDSKAATRAFQPEDLALFHALAQHIAIALENAQLTHDKILAAQRERAEQIAAEIQEGLMPKAPPQREGYETFGWYRSAEHVSGDFYDFVPTRKGDLVAVVGDVSGHGIGPALITATAQAHLRSYLRVLGDPSEVVTMLCVDLCERMDDGKFLTLLVAHLGEDGEVGLLNAGHTPPLVWRAATSTIESFSADGPALGLVEDFAYEAGESIRLEKGDMLLAFTDGLVEARHPDHPDRMFEEQGVRATLAETGRSGASAKETVEAIAKAALEFSGNAREDDVTIVAIHRV